MSETKTENLPARFDASTAVTRFTQTEADLAALAAKHANEVFDVSTSRGLAVAKEVRKTFRDLRTSIETTRTEAKKDALEYGRALDAHAKKLQSIIADAEKNADDQIKAEEKRAQDERDAAARLEQEKIARENALLDSFRDMPLNYIGKSVGEIESALAAAEACPLDELTGHAHERGVMLKAQCLEKMKALLAGAQSAATEAARRAAEDERRAAEEKRQREEKAAQERAQREQEEKDRAARQVREDEERAARQAKEDAERAEQRAKDAAERERLKKEAEDLRAEQAELDRKRIEQEAREREAAEKKRQADEMARIQKLVDSAPPLRRAAINALALLVASRLADADESIQLKAAIEADAEADAEAEKKTTPRAKVKK